MEQNQLFSYENILRNYPMTVMTKAWNPQFPGPVNAAAKAYSRVLVPDKISDSVLKSPKLKSLLDTVDISGLHIYAFLGFQINNTRTLL